MLLHKSMESQKHKWELGKKWEHKSTGASDSKALSSSPEIPKKNNLFNFNTKM